MDFWDIKDDVFAITPECWKLSPDLDVHQLF
jgi:hypothetical protein